MDNAIENSRREESSDINIRYIGYSLLKDVKFSGEQVVPHILSEGQDELGKHFNVEKLVGLDLEDFLLLPENEASLKDKFKVMLHITQQFQAIDQAGFILFDRHAWNIRVINWGNDKISTRQIDIDQYYDKVAEASYSLEGQERFESMNDSLKKIGTNLWAPTVNDLISQELSVVDINKNNEIVNLLRANKWKPEAKKNGSNLEEHETLLKQIIEML